MYIANSKMYLYALIKPHKYSLNDKITYEADDLKKMTDYDMKHLSECKDMLELILRAYYHDRDVREFGGGAGYYSGIDNELDIYEEFVVDLVEHIRYRVFRTHSCKNGTTIEATGRYADFTQFVVDPTLDGYCQCVAINQNDDKHCLVAHDNNVIQVLGVISEWQAHYIVISDMIKNMESYAKDFNLICDAYEQCCSWLYGNGYLHNCGTSQCYCIMCVSDLYCCENDAPELVAKIPESKNSTITVEKVADDVPIDEKCNAELIEQSNVTDVDIENYKKLLAEKCDPALFETTSNVATIKKSKGGYIAVKLDSSCEIVLRVDFDEYTMKKLDNAFPCDENLSDYAIGDVECVLVNGGDVCFAHGGFKFNNVLYKIPAWEHKNMLSCTARMQKNKKISEELTKTVDRIRKDIANLPEIDHCKNVVVSNYNYLTKITHGPNTFAIDLHNSHANVVKFQELIGKCNGQLYLFLKIGKQTYKIRELNEYNAGCMIMRQRLEQLINQ